MQRVAVTLKTGSGLFPNSFTKSCPLARIAFGVMGDAMGHITFSSIVASLLPGHEFLFLGGDRVKLISGLGYNTVEIPMLSTYYSNNRVDIKSTVLNAGRILFRKKAVLQHVEGVMKDFSPDIVFSNYEYFTPLVAKRLGIRCVSVDNQHSLTRCDWPVNPGGLISRMLLVAPMELLYSNADSYIITSFFDLRPRDPEKVAVVPSVLRPVVENYNSRVGDHVVVYQTSPTFIPLLETLKKMSRPFRIYGFGARPAEKNLEFKANSTEDFLEDLSSCHYAIVNGGHNVISESLYYGKPVLCFPIHLAYEQYLNAFMVRYLGYGDYSTSRNPGPALFSEFETKLDFFRSRVSSGTFLGNGLLAEKLESLIASSPSHKPS